VNLFAALDLALCVLCAYVGLYTFVFFVCEKRKIERLHFSLLCFLIALNDVAGIGLYSATSTDSGALWQRIQFYCTTGISIEFLNFTYVLIGRRRDLAKQILLALLTVVLGAGLVFRGHVLDSSQPLRRTVTLLGHSVTYYEHQPGLIWNLLFVVQLAGMVYLYALLIREFFWRGKRDVLPLLVGFLVFFIAAASDMLISLNVFAFLYTVEYAFLVMVVLMDYVLLRRFLGVVREVETLNLNLEDKVQERTMEIQKIAEELAAANTSLAERNATLKDLSERDSLTGLLNHAAFHRRLAELFHLSARQGFPICSMFVDVDNFKWINDEHGHQAGDAVIAKIAKTIQRSSRDYDVKARYIDDSHKPGELDIAGRYGGDEFAIAIPFCGAKEAATIAARICSNIGALAFEQLPGLRVTSSVGCAVLLDHSACEDELHLIRMADLALYEAKRKGRNQASGVIIDKDGTRREPGTDGTEP
jgi:GGDEF domain-containing protein